MAYGHKVFVNDTSFGLIPTGDKDVKIELLAFGRDDKTEIFIEIRSEIRSENVWLRACVSPSEAMRLAGLLRKMAVAAFEAEADS